MSAFRLQPIIDARILWRRGCKHDAQGRRTMALNAYAFIYVDDCVPTAI